MTNYNLDKYDPNCVIVNTRERKEYYNKYYKDNNYLCRERRRIYRVENTEKVRGHERKYYNKNKDTIKLKRKEQYKKKKLKKEKEIEDAKPITLFFN